MVSDKGRGRDEKTPWDHGCIFRQAIPCVVEKLGDRRTTSRSSQCFTDKETRRRDCLYDVTWHMSGLSSFNGTAQVSGRPRPRPTTNRHARGPLSSQLPPRKPSEAGHCSLPRGPPAPLLRHCRPAHAYSPRKRRGMGPSACGSPFPSLEINPERPPAEERTCANEDRQNRRERTSPGVGHHTRKRVKALTK